MVQVFYLTVGMVPVLGAWAATQPLPRITLTYLLPAGTSVLLNVVANVSFVAALARSPMSLTVPLLSLTPAFTALVAVPLLGERLSGQEAAGVALVVVGAFWLSSRGGEGLSPRRWARAFRHEPGTLLMVLVALAWSLALPLDKIAMEEVGPAWHSLVLSTGVAAASLGLLLVGGWRQDLRLPRRAVYPLLLAVLAGAAALGLQLLAIQVALVGVMEAVKRGVGNLSAFVWGWALFSEETSLRRLLALLGMAAGVVLILV